MSTATAGSVAIFSVKSLEIRHSGPWCFDLEHFRFALAICKYATNSPAIRTSSHFVKGLNNETMHLWASKREGEFLGSTNDNLKQ